MVEIQYKHDGSRRRYLSKRVERTTAIKSNTSSSGLPFGKSRLISQALDEMQSDMKAIGFIKKNGSK